MRYLSIYTGPERTTGPTEDELQLIEESQKDGTLLAAEGCLPEALGARVRLDGGSVSVKDGPFAESKEVIGGFAILDLASKEDAVKAATRFLEAVGTDGQCEVRELYDTPALGESAPRPEGTKRYLSVFKNEREDPPTEAEIAAMGEFMQEFIASGRLLAAEGCLPSARGFRARREGGSVRITDGPFTESKEIVGGFAILAAGSKDEAVELTKRFLEVAGDGECEVRELFDTEAPAGA